jgi:hypothetical protein
MIWIQHDFYDNFVKSIETGDIDLSLDIFRSEISDLLTYKTSNLFSLFDKLKIKYRKKSSYKELVDIIVNEIKTNKKFVRGLSFLICESNQVFKNNKSESWQKILNRITKGIETIAKYFIDNPKKEVYFKKNLKDMIGLKSSVSGDDNRQLEKKDNTLFWIFGIAAVCVAGYFIYTYFDKKRQERMRLESLNPTNTDLDKSLLSQTPTTPTPIPTSSAPAPIDPAYSVPSDVLLPDNNLNNLNNPTGGVQINVSTVPQNLADSQINKLV